MKHVIAVRHVTEVCRPGHDAATCRYLAIGDAGWECLKLNHGLQQTVADILEGRLVWQTAKQIVDTRVATGAMVARGDNCEGR